MVKPMEMPSDAPSLKKALHEKIERMSEGELTFLNRVLLQLEADELAATLDAAFDEDRKAGKLDSDRVQQVISDVRARHPYG